MQRRPAVSLQCTRAGGQRSSSNKISPVLARAARAKAEKFEVVFAGFFDCGRVLFGNRVSKREEGTVHIKRRSARPFLFFFIVGGLYSPILVDADCRETLDNGHQKTPSGCIRPTHRQGRHTNLWKMTQPSDGSSH